jgi:hypothetical protein
MNSNQTAQSCNSFAENAEKAVDVILKRMYCQEVSDHMLLRIVVSLSKSTVYFTESIVKFIARSSP